jgi:glycerol-3-phosphate acyltransferase PlsY
MTAAVCVPVAIWILGPAGEPLLSFAAAMAALVVFAHRSNIGRMNAGTEPRMNRLWLLRPRNQRP